MDRFGRIRIPKEICNRLGLAPGTTLIIEAHGNKEIHLRAAQEKPLVVEKDGVLVVRSIATDDLSIIEKREREDRLAELLQSIER
jgi:AbrB family looped-hinge helix DNA binding protein